MVPADTLLCYVFLAANLRPLQQTLASDVNKMIVATLKDSNHELDLTQRLLCLTS